VKTGDRVLIKSKNSLGTIVSVHWRSSAGACISYIDWVEVRNDEGTVSIHDPGSIVECEIYECG